MATWTDYKNHVRIIDPEMGKDLDEVVAISQIIGIIIERRHELNLTQMYESGETSPDSH